MVKFMPGGLINTYSEKKEGGGGTDAIYIMELHEKSL
jgi:hypothetical protein